MTGTECIIIGVEHQDRESYTSGHLLRILNAILPGVILIELDSSFFTPDHRLRQWHDDSLEDVALKQYVRDHPEVLLRPYDIEGRNDFYRQNRSFRQEKELFDSINQLCDSEDLPDEVMGLWNQVCSHYRARDEFRSRGVRAVNSFECDWAIAQKRWFSNMAILRIIERTPQLHQYRTFWSLMGSFEVKREYQMSRNIARYCNEFCGYRIVVLCGLEHRTFLRRSFPYADINSKVELREYWDYYVA